MEKIGDCRVTIVRPAVGGEQINGQIITFWATARLEFCTPPA